MMGSELRGGRMSAAAGLLAVAMMFADGMSASARSAEEMIPAGSRKTAPDFRLTDLQGRTVTLRQYRGKVVLLDFWAVDCGVAAVMG